MSSVACAMFPFVISYRIRPQLTIVVVLTMDGVWIIIGVNWGVGTVSSDHDDAETVRGLKPDALNSWFGLDVVRPVNYRVLVVVVDVSQLYAHGSISPFWPIFRRRLRTLKFHAFGRRGWRIHLIDFHPQLVHSGLS